MKLNITSRKKLNNWKALIDTIDKTDIPIKFVNSVNIIFQTPVNNVNEQDINIKRFRHDGWDDPGLDEIVNEVLKEHQNNIKSVYFYVDVPHVAIVVQQQTDIILKDTL